MIGLQSLGGFGKALMDTISVAIQCFYGFDVVLVENSELPPFVAGKACEVRLRPDFIDCYGSYVIV